MKEFLKIEWLNIAWIIVAGWTAYDMWGYWASALVTLGFFDLWIIQVKLSLVKDMLEIANVQRTNIAMTGQPLKLD
jgi:hypothetical protein